MPLSSPDPELLAVIAAGFTALAAGSIVRLVALRGAPDPVAADRLASLRTWWIVAAVVSSVALGGRLVAVVVFTVVSGLAFHEFLRLTRGPDTRETGFLSGLLLTAVGYFAIGMGWRWAFPALLPLGGLLWISVRLLRGRWAVGGVSGAARWLWGLLLTGYGLSHAPAVFLLPEAGVSGTGGGWFLLLVLLVEVDDISQALVGRAVGRRRLAPEISPQKTWEGLAGGGVLTVLVAAAAGPWITPLPVAGAAAAGLVVSVAGVAGDLTISVVKREAGEKDSGTLLPGHGGILDRTDSLMLAAPLFYYLALLLT